MKIKKVLICLMLVITGVFISSCSGNKRDSVIPEIQSNNIRNYLIQAAEEITVSSLSDIVSLDDWEGIKPARYSEFIEMMSLQDMPINGKRSELNVNVTGIIQRNGYRIEKLYYESLPAGILIIRFPGKRYFHSLWNT